VRSIADKQVRNNNNKHKNKVTAIYKICTICALIYQVSFNLYVNVYV